jgi:uncharacterized protein (TIGR02186 family)
MIRLALILTVLLGTPVRAEEVVAELSQNRVSITADFTGSEILLYGAVKREDPIPVDSSLAVLVTVEGPKVPVTVRRKSKKFGIWINTDAVEIDAAPSFYALATSGPIGEVLSQTEDLRHHVTIPRAIRAVDTGAVVDELDNFLEALVRIRGRADAYQLLEGSVRLTSDTLFSAQFALPSNLTEGIYRTRVFLTRDGRVIDAYETAIDVRKVGLERWIYNLAHQQPLAYGILSLVIAIAAGWGASAVFRYVRG